MKWIKISGVILTLVIALNSCTSQIEVQYTPTATQIQDLDLTPSAALTLQLTSTPTHGEESQNPASFPLAERGPYWAGNRTYTLEDPNRNGREIRITVWYPALIKNNSNNHPITQDAAPDFSGAPYPLILTGRNSGDYLFKSHLASHGFVMVIVRSPDFSYEDDWDMIVIDGPRDFLFTLNQLTSSSPDDLTGMIDTDRVGVAGYSWDGFFSLALGGVRIDPDFYLSQCDQVLSHEPPLSPFMMEYYCNLSGKWDQLSYLAGDTITASNDGLWQPLTDERILAVMPMAPDGAWLYGERGLSALDKPTLIITGTNDDTASYTMETTYIYEHLGTSDRSLISFIDQNHMMVFNTEQALRMNHFATAFFGYYLQDRKDYFDYFSEDFISQFNDLAWGVYSK